MFKQRDLVLIPFPFTDLSGVKQRPALVVSATAFNRASEDAVCCLVTSNHAVEENALPLRPEDLAEGSLPFESRIKPHRLFTVSQKIVRKRFGKLSRTAYTPVERKITELVRLPKEE